MNFLALSNSSSVGPSKARRRHSASMTASASPARSFLVEVAPISDGLDVGGGQGGMDRIGQAALFAHFLEQPRGEGPAAENMVDHHGADIIRVAARDARPAEADIGLRHVEIDHDALAEARRPRSAGTGVERGFLRQPRENRIEMTRQSRGVDRPDHGDLQRVARQQLLVQGDEILARDRVDLAQFAARGARIGMARPGGPPPGLRRHGVGFFEFALEHGVDLAAHPLQRRASKRGALIASASSSKALPVWRDRVCKRPPKSSRSALKLRRIA